MKRILLYTDGSVNVKTKMGGWACLLLFKDREYIIAEKEDCGGYSETTISRMEMRAIIEGLKKIKSDTSFPVFIISDSQFIVNSINKGWVYSWEKEDFRGRPNADLWKNLLEQYRKFPNNTSVTILHTKGHGKGLENHIEGNNRVDKLCSYKNFIEVKIDKNGTDTFKVSGRNN
jgi:ribonuclease HI